MSVEIPFLYIFVQVKKINTVNKQFNNYSDHFIPMPYAMYKVDDTDHNSLLL